MSEAEAAAKLRLFVAADVPPPHLDAVERAAARLQEGLKQARWVPKQNQHITLKFIGWVEAAKEFEVRRVIEETAAAYAAAPVSLTGFGCFPQARRARVLWVGVDDPGAVLSRTARSLDETLAPFGVESEARAFVPHLTVARFKQPQRVDDLPTTVEGDPGPFEVGHLTLYRSHLSPRGPRYEAMALVPLAAGAGS